MTRQNLLEKCKRVGREKRCRKEISYESTEAFGIHQEHSYKSTKNSNSIQGEFYANQYVFIVVINEYIFEVYTETNILQ